jgi:hypothetical protein
MKEPFPQNEIYSIESLVESKNSEENLDLLSDPNHQQSIHQEDMITSIQDENESLSYQEGSTLLSNNFGVGQTQSTLENSQNGRSNSNRTSERSHEDISALTRANANPKKKAATSRESFSFRPDISHSSKSVGIKQKDPAVYDHNLRAKNEVIKNKLSSHPFEDGNRNNEPIYKPHEPFKRLNPAPNQDFKDRLYQSQKKVSSKQNLFDQDDSSMLSKNTRTTVSNGENSSATGTKTNKHLPDKKTTSESQKQAEAIENSIGAQNSTHQD